jgi:hypothetical protein
MTPDLICGLLLLVFYLGTLWLCDIDWDQYRKANSGEETKGNQVNNREFNNFKESPIEFLEKLNLREYQKDAIMSVVNQENTVNSWARRSGKDVAIAASAIHSAIFNPYSTIVIYVSQTHQITYMKQTIIATLANLDHPGLEVSTANHAVNVNNSIIIIIKAIGCKTVWSKADIVFFNECDNEEKIQERIDLEKHEDTTFHVFGTYSIILDEQYPAKYTKISWKDFLNISDAKKMKNNLGKDSFSREFD